MTTIRVFNNEVERRAQVKGTSREAKRASKPARAGASGRNTLGAIYLRLD